MADNDSGNANTKIEISLPLEWAVKEISMPLLKEVGTDLVNVYRLGRDKIVPILSRKVGNFSKQNKLNPRLALESLKDAALTDDTVTLEYLAGVVAATVNENPNDDAAYCLSLIRSLSASQLQLHYWIYDAIHSVACKQIWGTADDQARGPEDFLWRVSLQEYSCSDSNRTLIRFGSDWGILTHCGLITDIIRTDETRDLLARQSAYAVPGEFGFTNHLVQPNHLGMMLYSVAHGYDPVQTIFVSYEHRSFPNVRSATAEVVNGP